MTCFSAIRKTSSGDTHTIMPETTWRCLVQSWHFLLLGVDIPTLEGVMQLNFLLTKKRTLEMMECVEELLVAGEVIEAVHQRIEKVNIARKAKVDEMMEALKPGQRQPNGSRLLQTLEANHPASCCAASCDPRPVPLCPRRQRPVQTRRYFKLHYAVHTTKNAQA
jgi:hypothetical protein